jgi:toxin ParE1/3/4
MSAGIVRRPAARRDVLKAASHIAKDNVEAALRFADAVRETEELLSEMPGIGVAHDFERPELAGMRSHGVKDFRRYLIFYIPSDGGIEIVRILHGSRDLAALFRED